jgi:hypothetical protein
MISQSRIDEATAARDIIGWSWMTVQARLGWSVYQLNQFKALRRPIADVHLAYLKEVAAAVAAIPVPEPEPQMPENVRVMLLDDIAAKLADEYLAARANQELTAEQRAGAQWAIGQIADRMSVADEVRALIQEKKTTFNDVPVAAIPTDAFGGRPAFDRVPVTE